MILFWLGFSLVLVVSVAGLIIFPCLALAGRADREMHSNWDDWASQSDEGIVELSGRIVGRVPGFADLAESQPGGMQFVGSRSVGLVNVECHRSSFDLLENPQ